jgi:hypothetical protein
MSFLGNLFGADDLQAESDRLDAQRRALNQQQFQSGKRDREWYDQTLKNDDLAVQHVDEDIQAGFDEGWEDGKRNITNAVAAPFRAASDGLGSVLKGIFKGVPLWLWLVVGVALFFWLGGAAIVRALVGKKFSTT